MNTINEFLRSQSMVLGLGFIMVVCGISLIRTRNDPFGTAGFGGGLSLTTGVIALLIGIFYNSIFY